MKKHTSKQIKRILVPTDFSANATNALNYAIALAKKLNASIILFHAYDIAVANHDGMTLISEQFLINEQQRIENNLRARCKRLHAKHGIEVKYSVSFGFPITTALQACNENSIDLIVMGQQGVNAVVASVLGTVTTALIDKAKCPVLVVPASYKFNRLGKIAYATDFVSTDLDELKLLVDIAQHFEAGIDVIHVFKDDLSKALEERMVADYVKVLKTHEHYKALNAVTLQGDNMQAVLTEYIRENAIELLVVAKRKRSFMERLFERSTTKKLSYSIDIPMLALHYEEKNAPVYFL